MKKQDKTTFKLRINIKAVIVILFGVFCIYLYFRLIGPYLDVGGLSSPVSQNIFSRSVVTINNLKYSYWSNNVKSPKSVLVMLPPSSATGDYFGKFVGVLPERTLVIAPDYPGRGLTDGIPEFDNAPLIAARIGILLENILGKKSFVLVGPSFGGMIATELIKDKNLNVSKLFLIATGEFFASDQKAMYKAIFYPASISEKIRNRYVSLLTSGNVFDNLKNTNIQDMLEQWITVIDYKIDMNNRSKIPTTIVVFEKDNVVQKESIDKLKKVFVNNKVVNLNLEHVSMSFFNGEIIVLLKNNL
jgi:pimeloyl-ACP methyl ester carboxylesterase